MTTISAAVQTPSPKPDRDIGSLHDPAGDLLTLSESGPKSDFELVLHAVSGRATASRSDTGRGEADERDDASGNDPMAEAGAVPAPAALPADPSHVAATLADILRAAASTAIPAAPAGNEAGAPGPASSAGSRTGPGAVRDTTIGGNGDAARANAALSVGATPGGTPKIEVLDRAVHFRPVLPGAAPRAAALPTPVSATSPVPASPDGADKQLQPGRSGSPDPTTARAQPGWIAWADTIAATAPQQVAVPVETDPEPRSGNVAAPADATGLDKEDLTAREDSRALAGIAKAILASTGHRGQAGGPNLGARDGSGTAPGQLAASLPAIAAAIRDAIDHAAAAEPRPRVNGDPAIPMAADGPLRVLKIQLRPEDLGTVTVELRLANGHLETHLRASRPETAALLQRDSAILTELLKEAHYRPEVTVGQLRPNDAGNSAGGSSSQGQSAFTDGGARPGYGGDRQRHAEQRPRINRRDGERMDETVRPRDGGVYL